MTQPESIDLGTELTDLASGIDDVTSPPSATVCLSLPSNIQPTSKILTAMLPHKSDQTMALPLPPLNNLSSSPPELLDTPNWGVLFVGPIHDPRRQKNGEYCMWSGKKLCQISAYVSSHRLPHPPPSIPPLAGQLRLGFHRNLPRPPEQQRRKRGEAQFLRGR